MYSGGRNSYLIAIIVTWESCATRNMSLQRQESLKEHGDPMEANQRTSQIIHRILPPPYVSMVGTAIGTSSEWADNLLI
jgi:hypothetical protein